MKKILGNMLRMVIERCPDADLKNRAVYFYRLIKSDLKKAQEIILGEKMEKIEVFFEDTDKRKVDQLLLEFNTLSVPYQKSSIKIKNLTWKKYRERKTNHISKILKSADTAQSCSTVQMVGVSG